MNFKGEKNMGRLYSMVLLIGFLFSVDYETEIQPIFDLRCTNCHGSSGGLNLTSYNGVISGGNSGSSVVPGDHINSVLWQRIADGSMPPGGNDLTSAQIDLIAQWIDEGALEEESNDVAGCTDSNAISCDNAELYFQPYYPECDTCSDDDPCENYYNPDATVDNGLCMYDDVPSDDEFIIEYQDVSIDFSSGYLLDWSAFTPPVDVTQYVLTRCIDADGDTDGDGELEYENCIMVINQFNPFLDTVYFDEDTEGWGDYALKYTLNVGYPNNNYWGSAQGTYYFTEDDDVLLGDVNSDGIINVIDIVNLVNYILNGGNNIDVVAADFNEDGIINVIDIVNLVNFILS